MSNRKLAHLADIQIRKGVRHDEYRQVFERVYEDLKKENPSRIYLAGDIFHNKVDMSPKLINITSGFFIELSKIAPVDIIPGNHDLNLTQLSQGDTNESIVNLLGNGIVVGKEEDMDYWKKFGDKYGIYYFPHSGYYNISDNLVYGHYSCIDEEILHLDKKSPEKTYVALFHGQVYESMNDNGSINMDNSLLKVSAFNNFDIVAMGDIHEHQTFREDHSMAYPGSLIQQNYGESIEKGYLIWDLEKNSFKQRYIPNDYGFAKISISHGEIWEERLENIQFSNDKEKTKIYVEWEDYEENYSVEKEDQIIRFIKNNYGSKVITVVHKNIFKDTELAIEDDEAEGIIEKNFTEVLSDYIKENDNEFDIEDGMFDDIIDFSKEVDTELEITAGKNYSNISWYIESMEVSNLFSYGISPIKFDFENLRGLTGIFGANYSGKTNFIKSLVWGLFQHILGGGDSKKLVNIFTDKDKAYVKTYLNIGGVKYRIYRSVRNQVQRSGDIKNHYEVKYEKWAEDPKSKTWKWIDEENDKKTNDKKAVKELVIDALGTPGDFAKVVLQSENGKDNYLNSEQQAKNSVIKKFLGLQPYSDRYDHVKKNKFNEIAREQKKLGNVNEIYESLKVAKEQLVIDSANLDKLELENDKLSNEQEQISDALNSYNANLQVIDSTQEKTVEEVEEKIGGTKTLLEENKSKVSELEDWLSKNFLKELPEPISDSVETLSISLLKKKKDLEKARNSFKNINEWIKENPKKEEVDTSEFEEEVDKIKSDIIKYENMLPTFRGEKCASCGHVSHEPQPEKEKGCLNYIAGLKDQLNEVKSKIDNAKSIVDHNLKVDKANAELTNVKSQGQILKNEVDEVVRKKEVLEKSKDILENNKLVEYKTAELKNYRDFIDRDKDLLIKYSETIVKINSNKEKVKSNEETHKIIESTKKTLSEVKVSLANTQKQFVDTNADVRVNKKSIEAYEDKLESIKEQEKMYKIYSIYLRCTHRDGIPADIIRKKLPAINSKIKSILKDLVEYNLELWLDKKGDVKESFYYNDDKSDSLPMDSSSGAQGFLANLAIRDALHYASKLPKSSMCIIDEGFGKLDPDITINMQEPLNYLKNKYRNVFVVTHKDIVKDFMDNIIVVSKSKKDISTENQKNHPQAWTTQITIK